MSRFRFKFSLSIVALLALAAMAPVSSASADGPNAVQDLTGCTEHIFPGNDDSSLTNVALPFTANYFGNEFSTVNINNNGNVTFDNSVSTFTPYDFTVTGQSIIAPYLSDVDTRIGSPVTYGDTTVNGHTAFCVNWVDVGYFLEHTDKTNSFQLLLIQEGPNPGDFVIRMNYDRLSWETGDASDGVNGFGGTSAAAGFSSGDGDPDHFFVFNGSFVNGALLDGGPDALTAGTLNAGGQLGRYNFPVVNAPPTGATLTGHVLSPSSTPLDNAPVEICPVAGGECMARFTNNQGVFRAINLPAGDYKITGHAPSAGPEYSDAQVGPVSVSGLESFSQDVTLGPAPGAPPVGTEITHIGESAEGVPTAYWQDPLTISTEGCTGATVGYEVLVGGVAVRSGSMAESPAGSGHYEGTSAPLYPNHGDAKVTITIDCPSGPDSTIEFGIYIDPSGVVKDAATGAPIAAATVTLFRSGDAGGPFTQVPDGSGIMSPANRSNPDTTDAEGHFGWDVIAGFYKVQASAPGCSSATTDVLSIPPPVTNLSVQLDCGSGQASGGGSGTTVAPPPGVVVPGTKQGATKHKKHKKHKKCKKQHGHKSKCGKKKGHRRRAMASGLTAGSLQGALEPTGIVPIPVSAGAKPR